MSVIRKSIIPLFALLVAFGLNLVFPSIPVAAQTPEPENTVYVYLFWGDGCPHCAKAKPYFDALPERFPGVVYQSYEVYYNQGSQELFVKIAEKYGIEQLAVPTFFVGPYYMQGYAEELNPQIDAVVEHCLQNGCPDAGEGLVSHPSPPAEYSEVETTPAPESAAVLSTTPAPGTPQPTVVTTQAASSENEPGLVLDRASVIEIPFFGTVNLAAQPALISTILIALIDGFNPCSLWVLSMLLALTLHTGSRKKVLIIGLVFLTVTAAIYALFIAGLFSILSFTGYLGWIQVLVALVALFFALVNIKDYFWFKEGVSLTISEDKKAGIFKRIRAILDASESWWGLISATIVLAVGVSMVEFSCTAGFPVVWVNLLSAQEVEGGAFLALLLLYMVLYQLDELMIFIPAVITLRSNRMEEKQGRLLKLIGGTLMLTLSITMLIDPQMMNSLTGSLIIFLIAFFLTVLVLLLHRVILPKFGIEIGSGSLKK